MITGTPAVHHAEAILEAIGLNMGIEDLRFDHHGHLALQFASGRHFGFQQIDAGLLIYVAEPVRYNVPGILLETMKRAQAKHTEWTVQAMLRQTPGGAGGHHYGGYTHSDDNGLYLLAMIRLSGKQASITSAQRALAYLVEWNPSQGNGYAG